MTPRTTDRALIGWILFWLVASVCTLTGWVANVVWLFREMANAETWEAVVSIIGVFVPIIGGIHGWMYML